MQVKTKTLQLNLKIILSKYNIMICFMRPITDNALVLDNLREYRHR